MSLPRALVLMMVLTGLAGCIADDPEPVVDEVVDEPATIYVDDNIEVQDLEIIEWEPNLLEAPPWRVGEWWLIEMTDRFVGKTYKFYRVVAGFDNATNSYLVGMPTHGFSNDVMVLHIPGYGQVKKDTLGYEMHDFMLDPLRFPVEDGDTWGTSFEGPSINTFVEVLSDTEAKISFNGGRNGHYIYDANIHAIREFDVYNYAHYQVLEHGYDFHELDGWNGQVTVPYKHDLIFAHGCVGPVGIQYTVAGPCVPVEEVEVPEGYDRASFITAAGDPLPLLGIQGQPQLPAVSWEAATDPAGNVYETQHVGLGLVIDAHKSDDPVGTWSFQHVPGAGLAFSEGIAYNVFDIQLPIGEIIETAGEHEHDDASEGH